MTDSLSDVWLAAQWLCTSYSPAAVPVTVRQGGHVLAKPGEKRRFNIHAAHVHLFDAQTGRRIPGL